jgi:hypothetical protein
MEAHRSHTQPAEALETHQTGLRLNPKPPAPARASIEPKGWCDSLRAGNLARMNREELRATLVREGINSDTYSLDGNDGDGERYVLAPRPGGWKVYYAERGTEGSRQDFGTEAEACQHLLEQLRRDETTHFQLIVGPLAPDEADRAFEVWKRERPSLALVAGDVRVDNPILRADEGPVRRYWVRGSKLVGG